MPTSQAEPHRRTAAWGTLARSSKGKTGSARSKIEALLRAGVQLFSYPEENRGDY
jgi:hypothetical protein